MISASLSVLASVSTDLPAPPNPFAWAFVALCVWIFVGPFLMIMPICRIVDKVGHPGTNAAVAATGLLVGVSVSFLIFQGYRSDVRDYEALPQVYAANNENVSAGTIVRLAGSDREDVRLAVAVNAAAPAEALDILSLDPKTDVRAAVAFNPSTPPETLESLAADRSALVRSSVGQNPAAPQHVLAALARDPDPQVRIAAVRNPSVGPEVLAAVEEPGVAAPNPLVTPVGTEAQGAVAARVVVASDPRSGTVLLAELARDPVPAVRAAAAANPSLPVRALSALLDDPDSAVAAAARDTLALASRDSPADDPVDDGAPTG